MNNNDLSMLLKAQVVELKARLDVGESINDIRDDIRQITKTIGNSDTKIEIPVELYATLDSLNKDIAEIQKRLKGSNSTKKIELQVKLDANLKDLQDDMRNLQTKLTGSKSSKPIKLDIEINVQGSAKKIKEQFDSIQNVLKDFQKGYGGSLDAFSKQAGDALGNLVSREDVAKVQSNIESIRKEMEEGFGEGLFSTQVTSDAKGNIDRLVATMKSATGEVQSLSYKWDDMGQKFIPIKQQDINQIEANTAKARQAIQGLYSSLQNLSTTNATSDIRNQLEALDKMDEISMDAVRGLDGLIRKEKEHQTILAKRENLYNQIDGIMRNVTSEASIAHRALAFLEDGIVSSKTVADLDKVEHSIRGIGQAVQEENKVQSLRQSILNDVIQKENQLEQLKLRSSGINSENLRNAMRSAELLTQEARQIAETAGNTRELSVARDKLNQVTKQYVSTANTEIASDRQAQQVYKTVLEIENSLRKLRDMEQITADEFGRRIAELDSTAQKGMSALNMYGNSVSEELDRVQREAKEAIKPILLIDQTTKDLAKRESLSKILGAVDSKDRVNLEKYIGELKEGKVHTMAWGTALDKTGRAVDKLDVVMQGTGKTVEKYTFEIDKNAGVTGRALRQVSEQSVFNANRNLGILEQLRIAMERVPIWAVATSSFYGFIRMTKQAVDEIMQVNQAMTELRRVASSELNLDSMLTNSVEQAKMLGTNIHDVLGSLGEAARTFGEFNEQALLAVNQTAIMMDNVSDLSLEESMNTLIGTMNAFNITAEDSIHIVNAFNEVDNQFAINKICRVA